MSRKPTPYLDSSCSESGESASYRVGEARDVRMLCQVDRKCITQRLVTDAEDSSHRSYSRTGEQACSLAAVGRFTGMQFEDEIGRASCRERVYATV